MNHFLLMIVMTVLVTGCVSSSQKTWYGRPGITTWNSDHTIKTTYTLSAGMRPGRVYEEDVHRPDGSRYSTFRTKTRGPSLEKTVEEFLGHHRSPYYSVYKVYNRRGRGIEPEKYIPEPWMDLKNLEPEIRRVSRKSPSEKMFPADLSKVTVLHLRNKTITSPSPIAWLTRVRGIEIKDGQISDFKTLGKELSGLPALNFCFLENCQIRDPAPLAGLMRVWFLSLKDNQITQLDFVEKFDQLETLFLNGNQISDLTPLAKVTRLKSLRLSHNQITDLAPLMGLTRLKSLDLRGNPKLTQAGVDKLQKALPDCYIEKQ